MKQIRICYRRIIQDHGEDQRVTRRFMPFAIFHKDPNPHFWSLMLMRVQGEEPFLEDGKANPGGWFMRAVYRSLN